MPSAAPLSVGGPTVPTTLALGIAAAFLVEGIAGSRAAWIAGNVLAVILGVTWLIRRR